MTTELFRSVDLGTGLEAVETVRRHWAKKSIITASALSGVCAAGVTAVSAFVGYKVVKPARRVLNHAEAHEATADFGQLAPEKVVFKSAQGGLQLTGYFYRSNASKAAIILSHGFHGGAVDIHKPALYAQAAGYNAFTFDFRGCGESDGKTTSVGFYEVEDLLGAIEYVKQRPEVDPERIALYGISMGGAVAIMAAARCSLVKALITDCAFSSLNGLLSENFRHFYRLPHFPFRHTAVWWSSWFSHTVGQTKHIDPTKALRRMATEGRPMPHLIIHGLNDQGIPVANAHQLYENSPGPKHLWVVPEAGHVVARFYDSERYMARINAFIYPLLRG